MIIRTIVCALSTRQAINPFMRIVPFSPELASAFAALNREWIERLFALEEADLKVLENPEAAAFPVHGPYTGLDFDSFAFVVASFGH